MSDWLISLIPNLLNQRIIAQAHHPVEIKIMERYAGKPCDDAADTAQQKNKYEVFS